MINQQFCWLTFLLISVLTVIYFDFIIFLLTLILLSILAVILSLEVNSRDLKELNYFQNNKLFDLDNEINLIGKDSFSRTSLFNCLNSFSFKSSPIHQLIHRKQSSYQKFNLNDDNKSNETYTGDSKIDEQINDLINLILRDYIYSWYSSLSSNQEFVNELRLVLQTIIRLLVGRISKINKINYITTKLVDNFVNHLKLYRMAKHHLKSNNLELTEDNLKESFFNFELKSESNKFCRDAVSERTNLCLDYLTELTNILEYLILPPEIFNNRTIKYFVNNLIINSTFYPLLDLLSDPDFINQSLITFCKSRKLNLSLSESFLIILRSCSNKEELNSVLQKVREETALQRSRDTGGDKDFEIKQQLSSLSFVNSIIKERLNLLSEGGDQSDTKINYQEENNNFNSHKNDLISLDFDFVLANPVALTYFYEYMITINKQSYLNFYHSVEGFRLSVEQKLVAIQMKESQELIEQNKMDMESDRELRKEMNIIENEDEMKDDHLTEKEIVELNDELKVELKSTRNAENDEKLIEKCENQMKFELLKLKEHNKAIWLQQLKSRAREEALNIYDTYLSPNSSSKNRIYVDDSIIQDLKSKIDNEELSETWFDTVHQLIYIKLREEELFFSSFKNSIHYYKLLKELGLLKSNGFKNKNPVNQSSVNGRNNSNNNQSTKNNLPAEIDNNDDVSMKSNQSSDTASLNSLKEVSKRLNETQQQIQEINNHKSIKEETELTDKLIIKLEADITSTGITKEFGKEYGVYIIDVSRKDYLNLDDDKFKEQKWCVVRRYSDFYTFHQHTIKLFPQLSKFSLPPKKALGNMSQQFLEQRKQSLNLYLKHLLNLLNIGDIDQFNLDKIRLRDHILQFFESGNYLPKSMPKSINNQNNNQILAKTMNSVFNPFKSISSKNKSSNLMENISKIKPFGSNNLNNCNQDKQVNKQKLLQVNELKPSFSSSSLSNHQTQSNQNAQFNLSPKNQANHQPFSINLPENEMPASAKLKSNYNNNNVLLESETNIPLRILLLLMDEIFDLKSKSFWLRRRIFNVIKNIIQTTYGNTINRKIIAFINRLFSSASIESYIKTIKKNLWPNGYRAIPQVERDEQTKLRTKVATKMLLLSIIPDDLQHVIGGETSRKSVIGLFNMLQCGVLNRRLVIVIFETFLIQLFPDNQLDVVFERLHSLLGNKHKDRPETKQQQNLVWPPYIMNLRPNLSSNSNSDQSSKTSPINRNQS